MLLKLNKLKKELKKYKRVAVAFSGGVDSTFLLKVCIDTLGKENVLAVTGYSEIFPQRELKNTRKLAKLFGVSHIIINTSELKISDFVLNPRNRCYFCKRELFEKIKQIALKNNIKYILEGSNYSDLGDYRPGLKAIKEQGIISPLVKARLTKKEIRKLSQKMNLPTTNKGSFACLASRFPYGEKITVKKLKMVDKAEDFLFKLGFNEFRVRVHEIKDKYMARIELNPDELKNFKPEIYKKVTNRFKKLGFTFVVLDLEGYKRGKINII